ncbi:probable pseudouridine-5'-phosphatase isoform X1 [Harmonia axyridis]|uniref:probable pseudouridine-5'-phosphatase isoform X1 n=1 Tax=Harmonia axyridis TaxID=115357 RepID=UPI001E278288|nr:probable pseudouridine-5'-phosphatase isoform X1 [Harmonia axyridis]
MSMRSKPLKCITNVIFDMDGLLLDTEIFYKRAINEIAMSFGKVYTPKVMNKVIGTPQTETCKIAIKEMNLPLGVEQFRSLFVKLSYSRMHNVDFLPDTEILYTKAYENILQRDFNVKMPTDFKSEIMGLNTDQVNEKFITTFKLPVNAVKFQEIKDKELNVLLSKNQKMPGAQKLVEHLHKQKIPIAVATSSGQQSFDLKTKDHKEFFKLFDHIVLGSSDPEVKKGKPAPDIFLVCASRFPNKPKPEDCLVFEDSPNGIQGANAAGMQTVMVPDPNLDKEMTKEATMVLKSLEEFKPELFGLPAF